MWGGQQGSAPFQALKPMSWTEYCLGHKPHGSARTAGLHHHVTMTYFDARESIGQRQVLQDIVMISRTFFVSKNRG